MAQRLFKYTSAQTATSILLRKKLRWSAPQLFNDPFEFKSPFQFNFDWSVVEVSFIQEMTRLITQETEPELLEDGPTAGVIKISRKLYKAAPDLDSLTESRRQIAAQISEREKAPELLYAQKWHEMKRKYRVVCFSEVATNILIWSHYADSHKGVVLGFQSNEGFARKVSYSRDVPSPVTEEDYVGYLTSQRPKPRPKDAFTKSIYTKSEDWIYEQEFRGFRMSGAAGDGLFDDIEFDPGGLKEIYFGCRILTSSQEEIIAASRTFQAPILFFQMLDEPGRFELTPVKLEL
jgi:hypothetical protein